MSKQDILAIDVATARGKELATVVQYIIDTLQTNPDSQLAQQLAQYFVSEFKTFVDDVQKTIDTLDEMSEMQDGLPCMQNVDDFFNDTLSIIEEYQDEQAGNYND